MKKFKKSKEDKIKEKEYSESLDIVDDIKELNEKYIKLFIDLKNHESIVDDEFYITASKALSNQYYAELLLKRAQARHATNTKFYLAETKTQALGIFSFRRWFKKYDSRMKQVLDARISAEVDGYLSELMQGVEPPDEADEVIEETAPVEEREPEEATEISADVAEEELEDVDEESELNELYELEDEKAEDISEEPTEIIEEGESDDTEDL